MIGKHIHVRDLLDNALGILLVLVMILAAITGTSEEGRATDTQAVVKKATVKQQDQLLAR